MGQCRLASGTLYQQPRGSVERDDDHGGEREAARRIVIVEREHRCTAGSHPPPSGKPLTTGRMHSRLTLRAPSLIAPSLMRLRVLLTSLGLGSSGPKNEDDPFIR